AKGMAGVVAAFAKEEPSRRTGLLSNALTIWRWGTPEPRQRISPMTILISRLSARSSRRTTRSWISPDVHGCGSCGAVSPTPHTRSQRCSPSRPRRSPLRAQQFVIEFADRLNRLLQVLVIAHPAADFGNALAAHA